jgi:hypothetical protein
VVELLSALRRDARVRRVTRLMGTVDIGEARLFSASFDVRADLDIEAGDEARWVVGRWVFTGRVISVARANDRTQNVLVDEIEMRSEQSA